MTDTAHRERLITYAPVTEGQRSAVAQRVRSIALPYLFPVAVIALWEITSRTGLLDVRFFSSPSTILSSLWQQMWSGRLWQNVGVSVVRILVGFVAGAVPGLLIGLAMGVSPTIRKLLAPTINALYPLPKIALIPLFLMIFGLTENMKYATIAMGVFFPVLINTLSGVINIDRIYLDVAKNYGANSRQFYRTVALPGALPFIFAGLRIASGVALLLIVAAEIVGTTTGIGYMIWNSWQVFRIEDLFIGLAVISVLGIAGNLILTWAERLVAPWTRSK
jgi:NitT/TauT family transport system permease protein